MARSDIYTILPIDDYARLMANDMCGFNQCKLPTTPTAAECPDIWYQQPDLLTAEVVGRDDVAQAVRMAEDMIANALGFRVGYAWELSEEHPWPYPSYYLTQTDYPIIQATWGMISAAGIHASSMVVDGATVTYTDANGDGYMDTATITVSAAQMTAAGADERELGVFYEDEFDDTMEIRPLTITENPTTHNITITGPACRFLDPDLWAGTQVVYDLDPAGGPPSGDFITRVDVRRTYNDTSVQGQIVWKGGNVCSELGCTEYCQDACVTVVNPRLGLVRLTPATYSATTQTWSPSALTYENPSAVRINYLAGLPKEYRNSYRGDGQMSPLLAEAVVRLANTLLPVAPCGCGIANMRWKRDRAEKSTIDSVDAALANSAFGTYMAGAIFAWSVVKRLNPLGHSGGVRSY